MSNILYTYGTIRPGDTEVIKAKGQMFDLGWFPGVKLGLPGEFLCERITVDNWDKVDAYEGFMPHNLSQSLYIRRSFLDGFIYEYNRDVGNAYRVMSGDWLEWMNEKKGVNSDRFRKTA